MSLVYRTAVASLVAQVIIGVVTATGTLFLPDDAPELQTLFALELSSQLIEFLWYAWIVFVAREILAWTRYVDWVLSTPVMLVSLALFFHHRGGEAVAPWWMVGILVCNLVMLAFGFVVEVRGSRLSRKEQLLLLGAGTLAFTASFGLLATLVPANDPLSVGLFAITFAVWGLYGVAAVLTDVPRNVAYNALDVVSKNLYGLFLFVYVLTL